MPSLPRNVRIHVHVRARIADTVSLVPSACWQKALPRTSRSLVSALCGAPRITIIITVVIIIITYRTWGHR
eukprot:2830531-Pyramimonas_sp.AAC.1